MGLHLDEKKLKALISGKLSRHFGKEISDACRTCRKTGT